MYIQEHRCEQNASGAETAKFVVITGEGAPLLLCAHHYYDLAGKFAQLNYPVENLDETATVAREFARAQSHSLYGSHMYRYGGQ